MSMVKELSDGALAVEINGDEHPIRHIRAREVRQLDKCNPMTLLRLDQTRDLAGVPVHLHMIFDDGGHSPKSRHYVTADRPYADACDFHFGEGLTPLEEFSVVMGMGDWGGIGYYPFWKPRPGWHVDLRPTKANGQRTMWWRDEQGEYHYGCRELLNGLAASGLIVSAGDD